MPNSHRRRGRSVSRESRHHRRDVRSRSRESRSRGRISRSRGRESHNSRLDLQGNRIPRQPDIASNSLLTKQMQQILDRLTSLEEDRRVSRAASLRQPSNQQQQLVEETATTARDGAGFRDSAAPSSPGRSVSAAADRDATVTDRLIDAIRSINTTAQSTGKLDSGMRGPYRVVKALPHGRYELQLLAGSYGKSTQAAAQFMKPWRGEWTPETCAAYFDGADSNDDNAESTPEQAANVDTQPTIDTSPEPMPSTSRAAEALQPQPQENGDVLQSGEAVLAEE
ncbi:hypothetical protein HF086_006164 [Spodoptera exigua]|uniref:Uncharacterized protein n=1 Tax=Spodoptera exigua TaxID=7107 RepID=A0A922SB41_SPOEX|nr:hypothetical protein HF086_006164 [Spodoptera exigua]